MKKILKQLGLVLMLVSLISCEDGKQKIEKIDFKILLTEPLGNADAALSADFKSMLAPMEHSDSLAFIPYIEVNRIDQIPKLVQKIEIIESSTTEWNKKLGIYALEDAQTDYDENIENLKNGSIIAKPKGGVTWADTVFMNQVDSIFVLSSQVTPFQVAGKTYPTFKDMNTLIADGIKKNLALGVRKFVIAYKPAMSNAITPVKVPRTKPIVPIEEVRPSVVVIASKPVSKPKEEKPIGNNVKPPISRDNPRSRTIEESKQQPPATTGMGIIVPPPKNSSTTTNKNQSPDLEKKYRNPEHKHNQDYKTPISVDKKQP